MSCWMWYGTKRKRDTGVYADCRARLHSAQHLATVKTGSLRACDGLVSYFTAFTHCTRLTAKLHLLLKWGWIGIELIETSAIYCMSSQTFLISPYNFHNNKSPLYYDKNKKNVNIHLRENSEFPRKFFNYFIIIYFFSALEYWILKS